MVLFLSLAVIISVIVILTKELQKHFACTTDEKLLSKASRFSENVVYQA